MRTEFAAPSFGGVANFEGGNTSSLLGNGQLFEVVTDSAGRIVSSRSLGR